LSRRGPVAKAEKIFARRLHSVAVTLKTLLPKSDERRFRIGHFQFARSKRPGSVIGKFLQLALNFAAP
jgi:hypothetical protein